MKLKQFISCFLIFQSLLFITACDSSKINEFVNEIENNKRVPNMVVTTNNDSINNEKKDTLQSTRPSLTFTTQKGDKPIKELITATTNKSGNPTEEFIKCLKGYKLTISNPWPYYEDGTETYNSAEYVKSIVERKYGVIIEETGYFDDYEDDLKQKLSSNKAKASIYKVRDVNFAEYIDKNYMASLDKAMEISGVTFEEEWYLSDTRKYLNINNNQYGWLSYDGEYTFPYVIIYNKNIIKEADLTDPVQLMNSKNWTWKKLSEYSKKLNDLGYIGLSSTNMTTFYSAMMAAQKKPIVTIENGKPKYNINTKESKNSFISLKKWMSSGLIEFYADEEWDYPKKQFASGRVAMILGSNDTLNELKKSDLKDNIGIVAFPSYKNGQSYNNIYTPQYIDFIPKGYSIEEMAKILFIRNEMYRYAYTLSDIDFKYVYGDFNFDDKTIELAYQFKYKNIYKKIPLLDSLYKAFLEDDEQINISNAFSKLFELSNNDDSYKQVNKELQLKSDKFWAKYKITSLE